MSHFLIDREQKCVRLSSAEEVRSDNVRDALLSVAADRRPHSEKGKREHALAQCFARNLLAVLAKLHMRQHIHHLHTMLSLGNGKRRTDIAHSLSRLASSEIGYCSRKCNIRQPEKTFTIHKMEMSGAAVGAALLVAVPSHRKSFSSLNQ